MCSGHDPDHWFYRRRSGWQLTGLRLAALGLMLFIGIGIPEIIRAL